MELLIILSVCLTILTSIYSWSMKVNKLNYVFWSTYIFECSSIGYSGQWMDLLYEGLTGSMMEY